MYFRTSLDPVSLSAVKEAVFTEVRFRVAATAGCADVQLVTDADFGVFVLIFIMEDVLETSFTLDDVDSVATSYIQLEKELIIKYSDTKYNINDFKTGDCETMLLNQTIYYLNISKSKWTSLRLYYPFEFASVVKSCDMILTPRQIGSKTLTFEMIEEKKILRIDDMCGNEVYLGWESVSEVWSLQTVLSYRLSYSFGINFKHFYDNLIRAVAEMSGDVKINMYNIVNRLSEKCDDMCCMLDILLFMPGKTLFDLQLERRIQEQEIQFIRKMWMLYAEQHWTKAIDLKSAVERLYEELGVLNVL
ncbi:hypothetical protein FQA39_LY12321 [Lamprigera yunnana]|nr:hypothetical protein FQA39_LY12321 [Lamprigera yunnana]